MSAKKQKKSKKRHSKRKKSAKQSPRSSRGVGTGTLSLVKKLGRIFTKRRLRLLGGAVFFVGVVLLAVVSVAVLVFARQLPSVDQITERTVSESTKIYDRTGTVLLYEISGGQKRTVVPIGEIPERLKQATIAIEDESFYEREGAVDVRGITRAFLTNLRQGGVVQGGSTITQQLAKNAFLTPERTLVRKLKELVLAIQIERHYPKDNILELYLNEIPYGPTVYGVEAASKAYFGKSVSEITLREAAVLAALPKAPSYYSPWGTHVDELRDRADTILRRMHQVGFIDSRELERALAEKITFQPRDPHGIQAPHFVVWVQEQLNETYGEDIVRTGGLSVRTSLDWELQQVAEEAVADGVARNEQLYGGTNGALVAQDPKTGEILALVGSRDYFDTEREGNFDVTRLGNRQPGSALKPFAYMSAFQKGYTPHTKIFDLPTEFSTHPSCPDTPILEDERSICFHPENFDEVFRGPVSLRTALAESINVPAVKTLYLAGISQTLDNLHNFGITTLQDPSRLGLSLVLGGGEVKLIDLVQAYGTMAQNGVFAPRASILEVKNRNGDVLYQANESDNGKRQVINPQYPKMVNDILSDRELRSGLFQSSLPLTLFPGHDVALKTGTTNDYRDAWAIGYTPSLVVGVWAGNNDNAPMHRQGSSLLAAVPMWSNFMERALAGREFEPFAKPAPVSAGKAVVRGDFPPDENGEAHTILHYINKDNPTGPTPNNPKGDSQYFQWEAAVALWRETNTFDERNPSEQVEAPQIEIIRPENGEFISGSKVRVDARVTGENIRTINLYLNGALVRTWSGDLSPSYRLNHSFRPPLDQQNLLEVEAENGQTAKESVIIYK